MNNPIRQAGRARRVAGRINLGGANEVDAVDRAPDPQPTPPPQANPAPPPAEERVEYLLAWLQAAPTLMAMHQREFTTTPLERAWEDWLRIVEKGQEEYGP